MNRSVSKFLADCDAGKVPGCEPAPGISEVTEATMVAAHKAGRAYWRQNRPRDAERGSLLTLARSCGWHDDNSLAWLAGFYGARGDHIEKILDYLDKLP